MVDAGGVVIWLGSAREDLVRGTVVHKIGALTGDGDGWMGGALLV